MDNVHFKLATDDDNIAWLTFDKADTGTNVLNTEVFDQLDQHLQSIAAEIPRGLVILSGKTNCLLYTSDAADDSSVV